MKEFIITYEEAKALYKELEHEFIPYENELAHQVLQRMSKWLRENELDKRDSGAA